MSDLDQNAVDVSMTVLRFAVPETVEDFDDAVAAWRTLTDARQALGLVIDNLADAIGRSMSDKRLTVEGCTVERHRKTARTEWDKEALKSAVLDSRLVDEKTGEVVDETPLDKVLAVWNLGAPRVTALRARHIDADQFCSVERLNLWTLREFS